MLRLKFERQHRQLSQHAVASLAHIPQPQVSQIERGRLKPSEAQLRRLADVFHVPPTDLLIDVAILGASR